MDRETARRVIEALTRASSEVATTAELIRGQVEESDFKKYVQAVGAVLGSIQLDLMASVLKDYPELDPDRESYAIQIQRLALGAITQLSDALDIAVARAPADTMARLKRGVGLSIGTIDAELLAVLYAIYPDIDHVKK